MPPVVQKAYDTVYAVQEAEICNDALARVGAELIKDTDEITKQNRLCRSLYARTRDELLSMHPFSFATKRTLIAEDAAYTFPMGTKSFAYKAEDRRTFECTYGITATLLEAVDIDLDDRFLGRIVEGTDIADGARIIAYSDTAHTITLDRATTNTGAVTVAVEVEARIPLIKIWQYDNDPLLTVERVGAGADERILCSAVSEYDNDGTSRLLEIKYTEQVVNPALFSDQFVQALALRLASKIALDFTKAGGIVQAIQGEFSAIMQLAKANSNEEQNPDEAEAWWTDRVGIASTDRLVVLRS